MFFEYSKIRLSTQYFVDMFLIFLGLYKSTYGVLFVKRLK